jgi:hypothetical protein
VIIRLAEIRELEFAGHDILFPRGSILAAPEGMRQILYAFEPGEEEETDDVEPAPQALEDFYTFHGRDALAVSAVEIPDEWKYMGEVKSVLYRSSKFHGGGNGTPQLFRHRFNPGTYAHRSKDNPSWVRIFGESLYVDDRGIVN